MNRSFCFLSFAICLILSCNHQKSLVACYPVLIYPQNKPAIREPPPPSMGLLYLFAEASKRLPLADFPKHIENAADNFAGSLNGWCSDAMKKAEATVLEVGNSLLDMFSDATVNMSQKGSEIISQSIDSVGQSMRSYLADWIGCSSAG